MGGTFGLWIGLGELLAAVLMLIFAVAFGIEHPVPALLGSLFIFFVVVVPIWATLKKSCRKQARRQQALGAAVRKEQMLHSLRAHQAPRRTI